MRTKVVSFLFILIAPVGVAAQDVSEQPEVEPLLEVVVSASRTETPLENVGRSVDVRKQKEIEETQAQTVSEALSTVSGVRSFDLGGPGSPGVTPIEIRGFRTSGTQLLLNGLTLSDPSSVSGTFEPYFSYLTTDGIASLEILKGGTGVLYGSDGQAGAIDIRTMSAPEGLSSRLRFEAGAYATLTESGQLGWGGEDGGIMGTVTRVDSAGLDDHGNYENTNVLLNGDLELVDDTVTVSPILYLIDGKNDLDTDPTADLEGNLVPNQDTLRNNVHNTGILYGVTSKYQLTEANQAKASIYATYSDRDFFFDFDGFEFESNFIGRAFNVELEDAIKFEELSSEIIFGTKYYHQSASSDDGTLSNTESRDNYSFFLYDRTSFWEDNIQLAGGYRLTQVGRINDSVSTFEASAVVKLPWTDSRLHSSVQQGFRAPTLFESSGELIDFNTGQIVDVGNTDLNEEETLGFDFGVGQYFWERQIYLDQSFFIIDADESILFDFVNNTHRNGGGGQTRGLETSLSVKPCDWYSLRGAYTYLDQSQGLDGERRQRRPWNWFTLSNIFRVKELIITAELRYRGAQELEFFGVQERVEEGDVAVFDIGASYPITDQLDLYLRADNVFDNKYTEAGYQMPRGSVYGGLRFKLS